MPLPEPSSFVGNGPNYLGDIQAGFSAVQQPIAAMNAEQAFMAQQQGQQAQLEAIRQRNALSALLAPGEVARQGLENTGLGYQNQATAAALPYAGSNAANANAIGTANALYATPNAGQEYLRGQLGNAQTLQGIGPKVVYNADGSVTPVRGAANLPGPAAFPTDLPADSSQGSAGALTGTPTVRQTTYFPGEAHSDPDTDAGRTSTGGPLIPAQPGIAGTAAVDPLKIPYGSIITRADGSKYVAADTGGAVKSMKASGGTAPVIDFASPTPIPDNGAVKIEPPTADYLRLSPAQKLAYHVAAARTTADPRAAIPVSQDGGALDRAIASVSPGSSIPGANLNELAPIGASGAPSVSDGDLLGSGVSPLTSPFGSTPVVHPAVQNALSVANQTASALPAASAALASKALDTHQAMAVPPLVSGGGLVPLYEPSPNIPGSPFRTPPKLNIQAEALLKDAADKGVNPTPFKTPPGANTPNGALDVTGLQAALSQKTQGLTISRLQQEFQNNKDVQAYRTAANQVNSIADNLNNFPFATRNAANDNAIEKAAAGNELPGQAVSQSSLNSIASSQTLGERISSDLSGTGIAAADRWLSGVLPSAIAAGPALNPIPRNLSDRALMTNADTVQSNVASRLPAYQAVLDQYRSQAKLEGLDPDKLFPPASEQPYVSAATRPMYPGAKMSAGAPGTPVTAAAPAAPTGKIRVSDGKQVIEIPAAGLPEAQKRGFHPI